MRVNMSAFTYQGACANYTIGEVEDYSVIIPASCDAQAGTLTVLKPFLCFNGESAMLVATADGNADSPCWFRGDIRTHRRRRSRHPTGE